MTKNKVFIWICLVFLLGDLSYTFYEHLQMPLDGDMAESVVPESFVNELANESFAFHVFFHEKKLSNPNRFFSHYSMGIYFRNIPLVLQTVFDPIESIYTSAAIVKTLIQLLMIMLFALLITGGKNKVELIICAALITPLFQTEGYNRFMGIIDQAVTYDFFYALPLLILAGILYPYLIAIRNETGFKAGVINKILMVCITPPLAFSGPLIPGVAFVFIMLYFINEIIIEFKKDSFSLFELMKYCKKFEYQFLLFFAIISVYSIYIGTFNTSNVSTFTIADRYKELPIGLFYLFTEKPGWLLLLGVCIINTAIILTNKRINANKIILKTLFWIGLFSIIYIILLPLGGYREYRSHVVRYDTFIPVTVCIMFYYGFTSWTLISAIKMKGWKLYLTFIIVVSLLFTNADKADTGENLCEKKSLKIISESPETIVKISETCNIVSWRLITDYHQSDINARLFELWNITNRKKYYYQSAE